MSWENILKNENEQEQGLEWINSMFGDIETVLEQIKEERFKWRDKYELLKEFHNNLGFWLRETPFD